MADGMIGWLAQRLGGWVEEAERRGRPQARRAMRDGRAGMEDLRALWERIEDLVERDVAPRASRYASQAGEAAAEYAGRGGRAAAEYAQRGGRGAAHYAGWAGEQAYDGLRDAVDRYGPRAREMAGDALMQARDAARARPMTAIALAVAGTWLVATMLRSGRR